METTALQFDSEPRFSVYGKIEWMEDVWKLNNAVFITGTRVMKRYFTKARHIWSNPPGVHQQI